MATAAAKHELLTLAIGGERYGVASALVREVTRLPRLARVPHAPPALLGLANIRGAVVPILSLAAMVDRTATGEKRVVIVEDGELVGLAVDEVAQLLSAHEASRKSIATLDVAALVARNMPAMGERRARGGPLVDESEAAAHSETLPLLTFAIGDQEFGFPLSAVDEVIALPDTIATMPLADAAVVGSAAVRDALLPLLSLRALLALPGTDDRNRARVVVIRIGANRVGLIVDAMRSIVRVAEDDVDPVPQVLARGQAETRIQAICRLDHGERLVSVLAADQVLREDLTTRLFQGSVEKQETKVTEAAQAFEQFLLFRIGEDDFGLPVEAVEEVALLPETLTRLPKAPKFVQGVMNLRGQVVPVIDQAQRFGAAAATGRKRRVVIVRIEGLVAGFVVDSVSDVVRVESNAIHSAPDLGNAETRIFDRLANLIGQDRIVLIVSPRELLDRAEQDLLRGMAEKGSAGTS